MNIAIDVMSGDNAPYEIIDGACISAKKHTDKTFTLIGDENLIKEYLQKKSINYLNISVLNANQILTMEDDPMSIMKEKKDSSMAIGLKALANNEVDVLLSAGNTGALHAGSTLIVRKIKGIRRSAIATMIPFEAPILMLDSGANPDVTPDILEQWAVLGTVYISKMYNIKNPRVGLLNNGTEEHKGTETLQKAFKQLKSNNKINFVGNVESKELPNSPCDILITDGFTGNITLKMIEGMGKFFLKSLKKIYLKNFKSKLSYIMVKKDFNGLKNAFDASAYGGAPLLGLSKPVIKAHGSSKSKDIVSAVEQAIVYYESNIISKVTEELK